MLDLNQELLGYQSVLFSWSQAMSNEQINKNVSPIYLEKSYEFCVYEGKFFSLLNGFF